MTTVCLTVYIRKTSSLKSLGMLTVPTIQLKFLKIYKEIQGGLFVEKAISGLKMSFPV